MFPVTSAVPLADLRRCARFYPHHGDTGAFFVALLQKSAPSAGQPDASTPQDGSPDAVEERSAGTAGQEVCRKHPLLAGRFERVCEQDAAWVELQEFFGIDAAWARDKMRRGLLFWQVLQGCKVRLSVTSESVARFWAAQPSGKRSLPWVRLGVFIFEQLPKGYLIGVAASRWRVAAEGVEIAAQIITRRRVRLPAITLLQTLRTQHRQSALDEVSEVLDGVKTSCKSKEDVAHACGGILLGVCESKWKHVWLPAALTPRLLRALVDDDDAEALAEILAKVGSKGNSGCDGCWAAAWSSLWRWLSLKGRDTILAKNF